MGFQNDHDILTAEKRTISKRRGSDVLELDGKRY
jgi:hypothetical protein